MKPTALTAGELDRASAHRGDPAWLAAAWASPNSRLLILDEQGRVAVEEAEPGPLLRLVATEADGPVPYFLGLGPDATAYFCAIGAPERSPNVRLAGLRDLGALLEPLQAELLVTAVALSNWHHTHPHCPRCGTLTSVTAGGWSRSCPTDGSQHFPRTDPAVIVLITDGADQALLGRRVGWPMGRYSTLAGFVEPGESAEAAVVREMAEEAGVRVGELNYLGSQPWPFPASLMLGFTACADPAQPPRAGDGELADVRWFTRAQLRHGEALLPPPVSIAHWLITGWLDGG
ncbi:MAG: NAD(+) diphosphatase [Mycobacteriales bacterium]